MQRDFHHGLLRPDRPGHRHNRSQHAFQGVKPMRFQGARLVVVSAVAVIGTSNLAPMTATGAGPAGTAAAQVERGLLITVLDKDNNPLRDLTAKDFLVFEDGVQREVTGAELTSAPISISIMLDTTKSAPGVIEPTRDIRTALQAFVQ